MRAYVKRIHDEYGLKVSLWCALGDVPPSYGDPGSCPPEDRVLDKNGKPTELLCFASPAFLETKEKRLTELCKHGAVFLMFDSDQYSGPCHDATHGHAVPGSRETHARALLELIHRLKEHCPTALIELHDPISGPSGIHYTPTYYSDAQPRSFDCLWAHEFMWGPMDDVLSRRAVSLYYYNMVYSIPLYLHVNLKSDNENALMFWWFASTVRHLGVGGKAAGPVWEAQKKAMATYKPLKRFYTQGAFYGLDDMVHVHTLADEKASVINAFNLDETSAERTITFRPEEIGLPKGTMTIEGATYKQQGEEVVIDLSIPAGAHQLIKVNVE